MNPENYSPELQALIQDYKTKRNHSNKQSMTAARKLLREAKKTGDMHILGFAHYAVADIYSMWGMDYDSMSKHLVKAVEYLQMAEEYSMLARAYNLLGINALTSGNRMLALDYYLQAMEYAERGDSDLIAGLIRCNMGSIYMEIEEYDKAISYFNKGMRILGHDKDDPMYFRNMEICCNKLGVSYVKTGKLAQAEKTLARANKLLEKDPHKTSFPGYYVIRLLELHIMRFKGDKKRQDEVIAEIMEILDNYEISTDSLEDICDFARLLHAMDRIDDLGKVLNMVWPHIEEFQITIQKIYVAEIRLGWLKAIDDTEGIKDTLEYSFRLYIQYKAEQLQSNRFGLNMRERMEELRKRQEKIQAENERLMKQATIDELTGLPNRYDLNEYAEAAFSRCADKKRYLAVEILDVDYFKQYNDTYGHQAGDECLQKVAAQITGLCQEHPGVYAAWYGGDEFVIIYEGYTDDEVTEMAERLRYRVRSLQLDNTGAGKNATVSISQGIRNSVPAAGNKLWDYMYAADNALYDIKKHNKGNVELLHKAMISEKSLQDARRS